MNSNKSGSSALMAGLRYTGLGIGFITEAGIVAAVGWWLDGKFETSPWLLVVGALLGVTLATVSLVKNVEKLDRMSAREQEREEGE